MGGGGLGVPGVGTRDPAMGQGVQIQEKSSSRPRSKYTQYGHNTQRSFDPRVQAEETEPRVTAPACTIPLVWAVWRHGDVDDWPYLLLLPLCIVCSVCIRMFCVFCVFCVYCAGDEMWPLSAWYMCRVSNALHV